MNKIRYMNLREKRKKLGKEKSKYQRHENHHQKL
jgi:hypothetical protein